MNPITFDSWLLARRWVAAVVALALTAGGLLVGGPVWAADDAPDVADVVDVSEGSLTWGLKRSWRLYAGPPALSGEVSLTGDGEYVFPVSGGSFDEGTGTTTLRFSGSVHWRSHYYPDSNLITPPPGYDGPLDIYVLDVTLTDPAITISPTEAVLSATMVSRQLSTWEMVEYPELPLASLNVAEVTPQSSDGATVWTGIPAAFTAEAAAGDGPFGGNYRTGEVIDPVTFVYVGPGGPPVTDEVWDRPGSAGLVTGENGIAETDMVGWTTAWIDQDRQIVHYANGGIVQAFDLDAMRTVGPPGNLGAEEIGMLGTNIAFVDSGNGSAYYESTTAGLVDTRITWDPVTGYETDPVPAFTIRGNHNHALWDAERERAVTIERQLPADITDFDSYEWYVNTYTRQPDGSFVEARHQLPSGPPGLNRFAYDTTPFFDALASDGSVVLRPSLNTPYGGASAPAEHLAKRIVIGDDGAATVSDIPGTDIGVADLRGYTEVLAGADGHIFFVRHGGVFAGAAVGEYQITESGAVEPVADPVEIPLELSTGMDEFALDPEHGIVWGQASEPQRLIGVSAGRIVHDRFHRLINPYNAEIVTGPGGTMHVLSFDGEPPSGLGASTVWGFLQFDWTGWSPTVQTHPESATVELGADDTTAAAAFVSTATGDPDPTRQWQARAPGELVFTDLDSQTGQTLTVHAARDNGGTQYRAVYTNPAGQIASDPATLEVSYAPEVVRQPIDAEAAEGEDVSFQVETAGNPEPEVQWQQQTDRGWADVPAGLAGYTGQRSAALTVVDARLDQSGTRFRAEVSNSVGAVYSEPATLTVTKDGHPGTGSQQITVQVPEGDLREFVWSIAGDERVVTMTTAEDRGDHWFSTGELRPIWVSDTRAGRPAWSLSGQLSDFASGLPGSYLGWTPDVAAAPGVAVAGDPVPSGFVSGDGLSAQSRLAGAEAGHALGTADVQADLELRLPIDTATGTYTATLTLTALS